MNTYEIEFKVSGLTEDNYNEIFTLLKSIEKAEVISTSESPKVEGAEERGITFSDEADKRKIAELEKENEMLRGLVDDAFLNGWVQKSNDYDDPKKLLLKFKANNNL